jgi:outer membrane beta-barrel protein
MHIEGRNYMTTLRRALALTVMLSATLPTAPTLAQEKTGDGAPVIEPQIDRRTVSVPRIGASDIEVTAFTGVLGVQNFGTNSVSGGRIGYHVTDRIFVEGGYGRSTVSDEFYRDRAFPIFNTEMVQLTYYNFSVGFNLLPGETFVTQDWALSSAFYFVAGIGSTEIEREKFSTFNFGFGYRLLFTDWLAFHIDVRDHVFNSDLLGKNQRTDNFEMTTGLSVFF